MTSNVHVSKISHLPSPSTILSEMPNIYESRIETWRNTIRNILNGDDKRTLLVIGPCSIHDMNSAKEYAKRLANLATNSPHFFIVMRVYFEKPRTTIGWKGMINDPDLNNTCDISKGLRQARELLLYINSIGLPCGCEFLDTLSPQYLSDLVSWGAIGARTTQSQVHRELASGLSMPVGFKNGTCGSVKVAFDAINSASSPHVFLGIDANGKASIVHTTGNKDTHVILRGGVEPNYDIHSIRCAQNEGKRITGRRVPIMVDCSHGNSGKDFRNQATVWNSVLNTMSIYPCFSIVGLMVESNLNEGSQPFDPKKSLSDYAHGVSITDSCIGWSETETLVCSGHHKLYEKMKNF